VSAAPLVGANGQPLGAQAARPELARAQAAPFPQLAGVVLVRIRPDRNALPEAWRFTLAFRTGIGDQGAGLNLDLTRSAKGRDVARALRELAAGLDALSDSLEIPPDGQPAQVPTPTEPAALERELEPKAQA